MIQAMFNGFFDGASAAVNGSVFDEIIRSQQTPPSAAERTQAAAEETFHAGEHAPVGNRAHTYCSTSGFEVSYCGDYSGPTNDPSADDGPHDPYSSGPVEHADGHISPPPPNSNYSWDNVVKLAGDVLVSLMGKDPAGLAKSLAESPLVQQVAVDTVVNAPGAVQEVLQTIGDELTKENP